MLGNDDDKIEAINAFKNFNPKKDRIDDMIIHKVLADEFLQIKEDTI
jgi:hypothetical protein